MALAATVFTWLVTALGAAVVIFFKHTAQRRLSLLLGFAAGVMLAASFFSLLQPAIDLAEGMGRPPWRSTSLGFASGAGFMWLADRAVSLCRRKSGFETLSDGKRRCFMLILSISLHNIPEGLAVGVAFGALGSAPSAGELMAAVSLAFGVALQNFPEGAAVSLPLRRYGLSRGRSFLLGQASGMVEPAAGLLGAILVWHMQSILPFALSFAAGAMVLVAVHELIPECRNENGDGYFASGSIMLGFMLMMLLDVALN